MSRFLLFPACVVLTASLVGCCHHRCHHDPCGGFFGEAGLGGCSSCREDSWTPYGDCEFRGCETPCGEAVFGGAYDGPATHGSSGGCASCTTPSVPPMDGFMQPAPAPASAPTPPSYEEKTSRSVPPAAFSDPSPYPHGPGPSQHDPRGHPSQHDARGQKWIPSRF